MQRSFAALVALAGLPSFFALVDCGSSSSGPGSQPPPGDGGSLDGALADGPRGPVQSLWIAPASLTVLSDTHFLYHPWPSDLRVDIDGSPHWSGFYNPRLVPLITSYIAATQSLTIGFS